MAIRNDPCDLLRIRNVLEWIGGKKHKIRQLSFFNRAKLIFHPNKSGGIQRGGLQRFERSESGRNEAL